MNGTNTLAKNRTAKLVLICLEWLHVTPSLFKMWPKCRHVTSLRKLDLENVARQKLEPVGQSKLRRHLSRRFKNKWPIHRRNLHVLQLLANAIPHTPAPVEISSTHLKGSYFEIEILPGPKAAADEGLRAVRLAARDRVLGNAAALVDAGRAGAGVGDGPVGGSAFGRRRSSTLCRSKVGWGSEAGGFRASGG